MAPMLRVATALAALSLLCTVAQGCDPGFGAVGSRCVACTGNRISPTGTRCVPCKPRSTAIANKTACVCNSGVVEDGTGTCNQCLPGYGGGACRKCTGKAVSKGGSLKGCAACKIRTAPNSNLTDCVCGKNVQPGGTCNACLPGFGGASCAKCPRNRFSLGTSILPCKACVRGSTGLADGTGCTCNTAGQTWDSASNKCGTGGGGGGSGSCPTGMQRDANGNCVCSDPSQEILSDGTCAAKCAAGTVRQSDNTCAAKPAGQFKIQLVRVGTDATQDATFAAAAAKWESIITVDLPDFTNTFNADLSAGSFSGYTNRQASVDDIVIMYRMTTLPGNTLGQAGPTFLRNDGSNLKHTPVAGIMEFDPAKIGSLGGADDFKNVILHEMGHVLGIGTVDDRIGCIVGCVPASGVANFWQCKNAQAAYTKAGCTGQLPIETKMGGGSGCGHWAEDTLKNELMTPVLDDNTVNPLSAITIGAMEDIYGDGNVNYSIAESWRCKPIGSVESLDTNIKAVAASTYEMITLRPIPYPADPGPAGVQSVASASGGAANAALDAQLQAEFKAAQRPPEWGGPPLDWPLSTPPL